MEFRLVDNKILTERAAAIAGFDRGTAPVHGAVDESADPEESPNWEGHGGW